MTVNKYSPKEAIKYYWPNPEGDDVEGENISSVSYVHPIVQHIGISFLKFSSHFQKIK